jgi:hypothetical protein
MSMMPLAVLRRIFENHRACKNECALHGELRNWLTAYGGDEKPTPRAGKPSLEDLEIMERDDAQRPHVIVDGRNGDTLERIENEAVGEALKLALEIVDCAASLRASIKTEQVLGYLHDYTDGFSKRFAELDKRLKEAGYGS